MPPTNIEPITIQTINPLKVQKKIAMLINVVRKINLLRFNKMISRSIESAQTKVEAYHFEIRKTLVDYDDVMNTQRDVIYKIRNKGLFSLDLEEDMKKKATMPVWAKTTK